MYIDFIAIAITISDFQCMFYYDSMFMMHFVIVFLNEYEWINKCNILNFYLKIKKAEVA